MSEIVATPALSDAYASDCAEANIMMDADALFPAGYHPVMLNLDPTMQRPARRLPRSAAPMRYYFIDFGLSYYYPPGSTGRRRITGMYGRDRDVPELSTVYEYNPFMVDIRIIGNLFRRLIYQVSCNRQTRQLAH